MPILAGNVQRSRSSLLARLGSIPSVLNSMRTTSRWAFQQQCTEESLQSSGHGWGRPSVLNIMRTTSRWPFSQAMYRVAQSPRHGWGRFLQYLTACAQRPDGHSSRQCTEECIHPSGHGRARFLQYLTACAQRPDAQSSRQCTEVHPSFMARLTSIPSAWSRADTTLTKPPRHAMCSGVEPVR